MVLPVSCLVIIQVAGYSRFLRSSILEVLGLDYIRTARAKGLKERVVLYRHALRNAALPFITILGLDIPFLLGGALVTETIFAWPGHGAAILGICSARRLPGREWRLARHLVGGGVLYDCCRRGLHHD